MATITKILKEKHGLLYSETFQESSLLWSLTPSNVDCLRFTSDGLRIIHNSKYISYTMKEPSGSYCMFVKLDHVPITQEDIGGIIILSNTNDYIECQTYMASQDSTIGNNGENITSDYDLGTRYVKYFFNDDNDESDVNSGSSSSSEEQQQEEQTQSNAPRYAIDVTTGNVIDLTDHSIVDPSQVTQTPMYIINPTNGYIDKLYKYIRVIKHDNNTSSTYQFFASHNGIEWIEVGSAKSIDNNDIGFFLYASKSDNISNRGKFIVNEFYLYSEKDITINGINILNEFEIYDEGTGRTILRSDTTIGEKLVNRFKNRVQISTNSFVLPLVNAKLRIYPKNQFNNTISTYTLDNLTFGGDEFTINYNIKLFINNQEIINGETYDLGTLYTDKTKRNIVVYNDEDFPLQNIKVSIIAYSEYYSGEEVVRLATYRDNLTDADFNDYIIINNINEHSGIELAMKLSNVPNKDFYSVANNFRFKLLIE